MHGHPGPAPALHGTCTRGCRGGLHTTRCTWIHATGRPWAEFPGGAPWRRRLRRLTARFARVNSRPTR